MVISANEANAITARYDPVEDLCKQIRAAAEAGKNNLILRGTPKPELTKEMFNLGYRVSIYINNWELEW